MRVYQFEDEGFKVEFIYSPFFEMMCSLHVITKPEHHLSRLNWFRDIKESMDKELYEEIIFFGANYFQWCSAMDFYKYCEGINDLNVTASIDHICEIALNEFVYIMLGRLLPMDEVERGIRNGRCLGEPLKITQVQSEMFINPEGFRRRFIACLKKYYYLYFERQLRFMEPLLVRRLKKEAAICDEIGVLEFVKTIHPRIEIRDNCFLFHKYTLFSVPFEKTEKIVIAISSFADPHLLIGIEDKGEIQLTIRANLEKASEEVPMDLFISMKAMGDETRLKILKCIYKKMDSTQSIAKELELTEAAISKHLKIMYQSGLLIKKRDGNFIRYAIEREVIDRIPMDMYQFLDN